MVEAAGSVHRSLENIALFKSWHRLCNKTHSYGIKPRGLSSLSDLLEGTRDGVHACFSLQRFRVPPLNWLYSCSLLLVINKRNIVNINIAFLWDGTLCTLMCISWLTWHLPPPTAGWLAPLYQTTQCVRNICLLQLQIWKTGGPQSRSESCGVKVFTPPGCEPQCSDRPGHSLVVLLTKILRVIK
jgi:hypothetical protein